MRHVVPLAFLALAGVPAAATAAEPWQDLTLAAPAVAEPAPSDTAPLTVTVSRPDATEEVTVQYRTVDGTAVARYGIDYTAASGSVTLAAGQRSATITIQVRGDRLYERAIETFGLEVTSVSGTSDVPAPLEARILDATGYTAFPAVPPGTSRMPDGDYACDGGFYSVTTYLGRQIVNCLGQDRAASVVALTGPLRTVEADADRTETFTLVQPDDIALGTAAFYDYDLLDADGASLATGRLAFNSHHAAAPLALPIPGDEVATGDRVLTLRLRAFGGINVTRDLPLTIVEDDVAPEPEPETEVPVEKPSAPPAAPFPATAPAPPDPAAPRAAAPAPRPAPVALTVAPASLAATLRSGLPVAVTTARPGPVTARLLLSARDRRALGLRYRTAALVRVTVSGRATLRLRLRADARRALRGRQTVTAQLRVGAPGATTLVPVTLTA